MYDRVSHFDTAHDVRLSFVILMMTHIKLSHLVRTLIIGNIKFFLRNLVGL
jgi:hypothetical protein